MQIGPVPLYGELQQSLHSMLECYKITRKGKSVCVLTHIDLPSWDTLYKTEFLLIITICIKNLYKVQAVHYSLTLDCTVTYIQLLVVFTKKSCKSAPVSITLSVHLTTCHCLRTSQMIFMNYYFIPYYRHFCP